MSFMKTYTGKTFFVTEPERTDFNISDVAHALSNLCRFGGHTKHFYSVAQHAIMVSDIVGSLTDNDPSLMLWGLMHDATEAYMIDLPTPIKNVMPQYRKREDKLMDLLIVAFKLPPHGEAKQLPEVVKKADRVALVTEARQLMRRGVSDWSVEYKTLKPYKVLISNMTPSEAKTAFLTRYSELLYKLKRKRTPKKRAELRVA